MIRAALLGLFCGAAVAATPLTRCVLALTPVKRDWLLMKGDPR